MKEATDATSGAEHHGSPAGMLVFQRSNPRGEEKALTLFPAPSPTVVGARPLPSPCGRLVPTPGTTGTALGFPSAGLRHVCPQQWENSGGGWASGPGNRVAAVKGGCGHGAFATCSQPSSMRGFPEATATPGQGPCLLFSSEWPLQVLKALQQRLRPREMSSFSGQGSRLARNRVAGGQTSLPASRLPPQKEPGA